MTAISHNQTLNMSHLPAGDSTAAGYVDYNWTEQALDPGGPPYGPPPPPLPDIVLLQSVVRGLQLYVSPVLAIGGILGNVVCVLVLSLSPCRPSSGRCFATALLAAETLQLLTLLQDWLTEMGVNLYAVTGWCHLKMFLSDGSLFLSTWYLVSLLITCFISSCFPDRECCNAWRHLLLTIILALLALVVYLNICLTASLLYVAYRPVCLYIRTPASSMLYLQHVDVFLNVLLPLLVNSVFAVCLCLVKWCCIERTSQDSDSQLIDHRYIVIHTLLWMPFQVARLHNTVTVISSGVQPLKVFLWEQIFKHVSYLNMSSTILVLLMTNSMFRRQLKHKLSEMWCKIFCCCSNKLRTNDLSYTCAAAQTSFIEANTMATETV